MIKPGTLVKFVEQKYVILYGCNQQVSLGPYGPAISMPKSVMISDEQILLYLQQSADYVVNSDPPKTIGTHLLLSADKVVLFIGNEDQFILL